METMLIVPLIDTVGVSARSKELWLAINHQNGGVGVDISRKIPALLLFFGCFKRGYLFGHWKWPLRGTNGSVNTSCGPIVAYSCVGFGIRVRIRTALKDIGRDIFYRMLPRLWMSTNMISGVPDTPVNSAWVPQKSF